MEAGSHRAGQGFQRVGSKVVEVARVPPSPDLSGHSRCPIAPGSAPSAARPSSSSPWLLVENCHRNPRARPLHQHHTGDPSPDPLYRHDCGCAVLGDPRRLHPLLSGDRGSSHDVGGHHSHDRSHSGRCCSTHHQS